MTRTMRILTLLLLTMVGAGQMWADALSNPRVKFVYSGEQHGTAFASEANGNGVVTITITPDGDWRCIDGDVTAKVTANTNMAQAPRRTQAEVQIGDAIGVTCTATNVFTLTLPDNANLNATVTISFSEKLDNAFTVSLDNWTYGEAPKTPHVENNQSGNEPTYTYSNAENGDYSSTVPSIAGTHWVKASIAASTDYKACESEPVAFIIAKAPLTVTANDHSIFYGNAAANNGVTYNGFVNGETESVLGGTLTYTYSNANGAYSEGNDAPGNYVITPRGLTSNNYDITFIPGVLEVFQFIVEVKVVDATNSEEIGKETTFQVLDGDGNVVIDYNGNDVIVTSTGGVFIIDRLKAGKTYTLRETVAPEGYVLPTDDITFTINEKAKVFTNNQEVSELLVRNAKTHVEVSVVDIVGGAELVGAHVQVLDGDGNVVKDLEGNNVEWTSTTENHVIEGLKTGEEYTLRESVAPNGYLFYADNTFTIAADGTITYTGTMTEDKVLLVKNSISVDVSVAVVWNDGNNTEGFRPESVIVRLKKGDETIGSKELNTTNNWTDTFADLYKYDDAGDEITYIVTEDDVENYTTNVVGYTITNQRDIEETEATVKVVWVDGNDELHNRPESVTATLSDNTHTVTLNAVNEWTTTVTGLQKYSNATPIVYTWTQDEDALPEGYVQTNSAVTEAVTTFTDSYYPAVTVTITGHNNETTYDGTEHVVSGYEAVSSYSLYTADDFTFSGMASASQTNAGTAYMSLAASQFVNDNANYDGKVTFVIAENGDGYQTITPASVIVKADDKSKEWGTADDPTLTATVTGMVNDEDASTLIAYTIDRATGTITDGVENSGEYTITPTGDATQGNYAVTYKTGKFTIEGKPVTIQDVEGHDVSSVDDAYTITQDQNGVTLTLVVPDETTTPPTVDIPVAVEVNHVVIDRLFESGKAATVYLPFSIEVSKIGGGTFHTFGSVDETTTPLWTVTYSAPLADDAILQAGTPYIFMPDGSNGGKIVVNNGNEKISICTADQHKDKQGQWEFIGTYNPIVWLSDPNATGYTPERAAEIGSVYGFAAEEKTFDGKDYTVGQFVKVGSGASIDPNRAYLKRIVAQQAPALGAGSQTAVEMPSAMRVVLISANGETTSIDHSPLTIDHSADVWYTLDGRKLDKKPTQKGVYIMNGRKVVIK